MTSIIKFSSRFFNNYKMRKISILIIALLCFLIILFQVFWLKSFLLYLSNEKEYYGPDYVTQIGNSQKPIFFGIVTYIWVSSALLLILSFILIWNITKQKNNNRIYLRVITWFALINFILLFFLMSLQPVKFERYKPKYSILPKANYSSGYIVIIAAFLIFVFGIVSRTSFGYLTNDKQLNKVNKWKISWKHEYNKFLIALDFQDKSAKEKMKKIKNKNKYFIPWSLKKYYDNQTEKTINLASKIKEFDSTIDFNSLNKLRNEWNEIKKQV